MTASAYLRADTRMCIDDPRCVHAHIPCQHVGPIVCHLCACNRGRTLCAQSLHEHVPSWLCMHACAHACALRQTIRGVRMCAYMLTHIRANATHSCVPFLHNISHCYEGMLHPFICQHLHAILHMHARILEPAQMCLHAYVRVHVQHAHMHFSSTETLRLVLWYKKNNRL